MGTGFWKGEGSNTKLSHILMFEHISLNFDGVFCFSKKGSAGSGSTIGITYIPGYAWNNKRNNVIPQFELYLSKKKPFCVRHYIRHLDFFKIIGQYVAMPVTV